MDIALFEVGPVFHGGEPEEQHVQVAGLLVGRSGPKDVHGASRPVDVYDVKADAEAVLAALGAPEPELPPFDESKFEPMPTVEINPDDEYGGKE